MRKIAEIRKDLAAKIELVKGLSAGKNAEELAAALDDLRSLGAELDAANEVEAAEQRMAQQAFQKAADKAGMRFSLIKFIRELAEKNGLTGLEADIAGIGSDEYRRLGLTQEGVVLPLFALRSSTGQNATTPLDGGNLVQDMDARYVEMLKSKLCIGKLGATILPGLVGNVPLISSSQIAAAWGAEGDVASLVKTTYSKASMTPHRNMIYAAFSKDLLRQTSFSVEADLQSKLINAHADLLESGAITGTGANNQPTGILATAGISTIAMGTNGGSLNWAKIVALETAINNLSANRGSMAYLTNSKVWGALKTTEKVASTGKFLMDEVNIGHINGYPIDWSSMVPSNLTKGTSAGVCSALIFGNFQDLYLGSWGGLDLVVDPYTGKNKAEIEIAINAWDDVKVAEPKSFAVIKDITTD